MEIFVAEVSCFAGGQTVDSSATRPYVQNAENTKTAKSNKNKIDIPVQKNIPRTYFSSNICVAWYQPIPRLGAPHPTRTTSACPVLAEWTLVAALAAMSRLKMLDTNLSKEKAFVDDGAAANAAKTGAYKVNFMVFLLCVWLVIAVVCFLSLPESRIFFVFYARIVKSSRFRPFALLCDFCSSWTEADIFDL